MQIATVDLTDDLATRKLFADLRPDAIVHCAAAANVDWCEENPKEAEAINVQATATLASIAATLHASFIYVSTDSVFNGNNGNYVESDKPAPLNVYARSKFAGEQETLRCNPSAAIVRVNIYGWNAQNKQSLAEWILGRLEDGQEVPGFTDVYFSPILVNDLAPILLAILQQKLSGLYHVAGAERISKFEFAKKLAAVFGFDPAQITPCHVKDMKLRAKRPLDISLNTEKIEGALGLAMPNVDAGLTKFRELRDRKYPQQLKNSLREGSRS